MEKKTVNTHKTLNLRALAEVSEIEYNSIFYAARKDKPTSLSVTERKKIISELEKAHKANIKFFDFES